MTEQQVPCVRCRRENPPSDRFCGSCGARLTGGGQPLATRQEHGPVPASRAWPATLGPAGKVLAVGVAALAAEAGLLWLRRRIGAEDRSSVPAVRGVGPAPRGYLVGRSLEEVFVEAWGEDPHGRVFARREVRSFVAPGPTGGRR